MALYTAHQIIAAFTCWEIDLCGYTWTLTVDNCLLLFVLKLHLEALIMDQNPMKLGTVQTQNKDMVTDPNCLPS